MNAGALTFQEFIMRDKLPLATIHETVLEFLRGRDDVVLFGAQAVNAYVKEPRMTQDIDVLSTRAEEIAQELRDHLSKHFHIAVRVRSLRREGYRLFQVRKPANRHLVDVRPVNALPPTKRIAKILVAAPEELIARKVTAYCQRRGMPKAGTDWRDLAMLLLEFPELKRDSGPVMERLQAAGAGENVLSTWGELVAQEIRPTTDGEDF